MGSKYINKIEKFTVKYTELSDEDLKKESQNLKEIIQKNKKITSKTLLGMNVLPQAFALVREATNRALKMTQFDNQILAAIELIKGNIVQMNPGEGKSFVIMLAVYLKALSGKSVHVMVENDFLLQRDFHKTKKVLDYLDVSVGAIPSRKAPEYEEIDKAKMYACNVVYIHPIEAGFDYMKSNDKDYIKNSEIIVDDIDRIIATKEPTSIVLIEPETNDTENMLLVDFIKEYKQTSGLADSALKEKKFYKKYLNKKVVVIPDNIKNIRKDLPDNISKTKQEKYDRILEETLEVHKYRCPVLIVVPNEDELGEIRKRLDKKGFTYKYVSGRHHNSDAMFLSQAGAINQVTVVTRPSGIDTPLGGDSFYLTLQYLAFNNLKPYSEEWKAQYRNTYETLMYKTEQEKKQCVELGGLYTIITAHTDKDDVFKGFAARRGEPGSAKFFVSLEDDFFKDVSMNRFFALINSLNLSQDKIINNTFISNLIIKFTTFVNQHKNRIVK